MSLNQFITCDGCNKEIMAGDPAHQTREEFGRNILDHDGVAHRFIVSPRRDLCDACATRAYQMIVTTLPDCLWLLDGFEVVK